MAELTNEQNAKAVDLYEQSFYGKDGYNGAHDCFIDDALTNEQNKIFDLLKDPYLTQQQKAEAVDLFQAMLWDHCQNLAAMQTN